MDKNELISKLYSDTVELSKEEIVYLANLIAKDRPVEDVPYSHSDPNILKAIGFQSRDHYQEYVNKENQLLERLSKEIEMSSQVVEIVENRVKTDPLALRAILIGISSYTPV